MPLPKGADFKQASASNHTGLNVKRHRLTRVKEALQQLNERLIGNRFLHGASRIGGVRRDLSPEGQQDLNETLARVAREFGDLVNLIMGSETAVERFGKREQKAVRLGRHKYLSIDGNEFLFDIAADPLPHIDATATSAFRKPAEARTVAAEKIHQAIARMRAQAEALYASGEYYCGEAIFLAANELLGRPVVVLEQPGEQRAPGHAHEGVWRRAHGALCWGWRRRAPLHHRRRWARDRPGAGACRL